MSNYCWYVLDRSATLGRCKAHVAMLLKQELSAEVLKYIDAAQSIAAAARNVRHIEEADLELAGPSNWRQDLIHIAWAVYYDAIRVYKEGKGAGRDSVDYATGSLSTMRLYAHLACDDKAGVQLALNHWMGDACEGGQYWIGIVRALHTEHGYELTSFLTEMLEMDDDD